MSQTAQASPATTELSPAILKWVSTFTGLDLESGQPAAPASGEVTMADNGSKSDEAPVPAPGGVPGDAPGGAPGGSASAPGGAKAKGSGKGSGAAPANAAAIKALADRLPNRADGFLASWLGSLTQAILTVPPPHIEDNTDSSNFYVALAGNLAWAATCLIPEAKFLVVALSFGGATVGSGALAKDPKAQPPAPAADLIDRCDKARDAISKNMEQRAKTIAAEIVAAGALDGPAQDRALWSRIFRGVEYNSVEALKARSVAMLTEAGKQYTSQWKAWSAKTEEEATKRNNAAYQAYIKEHPEWLRMRGGPPPWRDPDVAGVRKEMPFTPVLRI